MAWAGLALSALGTVASASAQQQQAAAQAKAANFNAAIVQQEAQSEKEKIYRESQVKLGKIQAARAKGGVSNEGTPLLVMAESQANAEADAYQIQYAANIEHSLYKSQASSAVTAGRTGAGASLLSGASKFF